MNWVQPRVNQTSFVVGIIVDIIRETTTIKEFELKPKREKQKRRTGKSFTIFTFIRIGSFVTNLSFFNICQGH